jgi:hypothetical protein
VDDDKNDDAALCIYKNGVIVVLSEIHNSVKRNELQACSTHVIIPLANTDTLEVKIKNATGDKNITVNYMNLVVTEI